MVKKIAVVGLGYVGLPLAVSLSHHFMVTGFDINHKRIDELKTGFDHTHEIESTVLKSAPLHFTQDAQDLKLHDMYIVTVPTPVTPQNTPSLDYLQSASEIIGSVLQKNAIVVFESTVYPGVTEDFCGKILSDRSGLICGKDFFLGYSPERINPGDREHTVDKITKIVGAVVIRSTQAKILESEFTHFFGQNNGDGIGFLTHCRTGIPHLESHSAAGKVDSMFDGILDNRKISEKKSKCHAVAFYSFILFRMCLSELNRIP